MMFSNKIFSATGFVMILAIVALSLSSSVNARLVGGGSNIASIIATEHNVGRELSVKTTEDPSECLHTLLNTIKYNIGSAPPKSDAGEWGEYIDIATTAWGEDGADQFTYYTSKVQSDSYTNGEDQNSWSLVLSGAKAADSASNLGAKLTDIAQDLAKITDPSHNDWAWCLLNKVGAAWQNGQCPYTDYRSNPTPGLDGC
jgi:hypothetical protein